jgi:hypothetical protein
LPSTDEGAGVVCRSAWLGLGLCATNDKEDA